MWFQNKITDEIIENRIRDFRISRRRSGIVVCSTVSQAEDCGFKLRFAPMNFPCEISFEIYYDLNSEKNMHREKFFTNL